MDGGSGVVDEHQFYFCETKMINQYCKFSEENRLTD